MPEDAQPIEVHGYSADSSAYYARGLRCYLGIQEDARPERLFYAALELRNCIERLLFEYLVLFGRHAITKAQAKAYRATQIKDSILEMEPDFEAKLKFTGLLTRALSGSGVYVVSLDELSGLYGRLGAFLHAPKRPDRTVEDPRWWGRLNQTLKDTLAVLDQVYAHAIAGFQLSDEGHDLYARWMRGEIGDEQAVAEFLEGLGPFRETTI